MSTSVALLTAESADDRLESLSTPVGQVISGGLSNRYKFVLSCVRVNMSERLDARGRQKRDLEDMANCIETIDPFQWNPPLAVTLNFRPSTSRYQAERSIILFLNQLSKQTYTSAYRNHRKGLKATISYEGVDETLHCHLTLESSPYHELEEFMEMAEALWRNNRFGRTHIRRRKSKESDRIFDIKPMTSAGWQKYVAKVGSKSSSDDFDLYNVYFE